MAGFSGFLGGIMFATALQTDDEFYLALCLVAVTFSVAFTVAARK